jgi:hypothetical protein
VVAGFLPGNHESDLSVALARTTYRAPIAYSKRLRARDPKSWTVDAVSNIFIFRLLPSTRNERVKVQDHRLVGK